MVPVRDSLAMWRVGPQRVRLVLSAAAAGYVDRSGDGEPEMIELLVEAGADLDEARRIRDLPRRIICLCDAQLGG